MKRVLLLGSILVVTSCGKKTEEAKKEDVSKTEVGSDKPAPKDEPKKEEEKKEEKVADVPMIDHDLAPFGKQFAGWVVTAPQTAKLEFDDPSRHIVLSDTDFVVLDEAPYWEDGIKTLKDDKDNQNIKNVSPTEVRYERTPPLGKSWLVDILIKVGKEKWGCGTGMTGTFTSEAMADRIATICKSIRKK